jgi:hypothetical protein
MKKRRDKVRLPLRKTKGKGKLDVTAREAQEAKPPF